MSGISTFAEYDTAPCHPPCHHPRRRMIQPRPFEKQPLSQSGLGYSTCAEYDCVMGGKKYYVYIMASDRNGTLYIGVTSDLIRRVHNHRTKADRRSFTARYNVKDLVHFEIFDDPENAIYREKRLKSWNRLWKMRLIEDNNPGWTDLYPTIL